MVVGGVGGLVREVIVRRKSKRNRRKMRRVYGIYNNTTGRVQIWKISRNWMKRHEGPTFEF